MSNRSKSKKMPSVFKIILFLLAIVLLMYGGWEARRFLPYPPAFARFGIENWQVWEFHDYFNLNPDIVSVIIEGRRLTNLDTPPVFIDGDLYFTTAFVREHIDTFMFWDERAGVVFVSDNESVTRLVPSPGHPVIIREGQPWIAKGWLQLRYTNFEIEYSAANNIVTIANLEKPAGRAAVTSKSTRLRYLPNRTAFISQNLNANISLTTFYKDGEFIRVRTAEGLLGYVLTADINFTQPPIEEAVRPAAPLPSPRINLSWELITAAAANTNAMNRPLPEGLNVISPTWFSFDPNTLNGDIISLASQEYVDWAHSYGVEVWAHIFDTNTTISGAILTNYQARERAVSQLLDFVVRYNLDGINVNFEYVPSDAGGYYLQFLRELAPGMRRLGAILSVATFVPAPWRTQYHHHLVGKTVDFVAIMTYDEHVGVSDNPGPVASLPFVHRFVRESAELIPNEKLLMGLPFYNRVWRILPDGSHTASAYGFSRPWTLVEEWGVTPVWNPEVGSYYATHTVHTEDEGEVTYRIWIECERSIAEKLRIVNEFELAGVASWRRSLETEGVWEEIRRVLR